MFPLGAFALMKEIFNGKALDVKYEHDFREKKVREDNRVTYRKLEVNIITPKKKILSFNTSQYL